jgi:histidine ammonia-lyase
MMRKFSLGKDRLTTAQLVALGSSVAPAVSVDPDTMEKCGLFRGKVAEILNGDDRVYGINTGFGYLSNVAIPKDKLQQLQLNLVRSHACGVGRPVDDEIVRALLVLRAHTFLIGNSGVRPVLVEKVLEFLRHDILPVIPCQGSVGASGDLAPLSHLAMGLMGEGEVRYQGKTRAAKDVLNQLGVEPIRLEAKEGLSLINGTHFMTVLAAFAVERAKNLAGTADIVAGLSLSAVRGTTAAYDPRISAVRPQSGQTRVAANMRALFAQHDPIMESHADCDRVQDPYSFRCVPQVHGASRDAVLYVQGIVDTELNSVTDNPLVFDDGSIISGGNFHGQPIAISMDFLAIAVAELASISERRIEKLTNPSLSGLPAFVMKDSGLNSGFMIPHVVAAALVSENKSLAHPASVDSIPTSADKEDHVSMGPIAARKALEIIENTRKVLAIEALTAVQGIDLLAPLKPNATLSAVLDAIRAIAPTVEVDRSMHKEIETVADWISGGGMQQVVRKSGVELQ